MDSTHGHSADGELPYQLRPLPAGATGLLPAGHTPPDPRRVLALLHEAARTVGWTAGQLTDPSTLRSFRSVRLGNGQEPPLWALVHDVLAVVAFTDRDPEQELVVGHHVIDWPALPAGRVADGAWVVLGQERAREHPQASDLVALSPGEMTQVRHWQATTIGEILFNHWD